MVTTADRPTDKPRYLRTVAHSPWGTPVIAGAAGFGLSFALGADLPFTPDEGQYTRALLSSAVTFSAITAGFTASAMSILIVSHRGAVQKIRSLPRYQYELKQMLSASFFMATAVAVFSMVILLTRCGSPVLTSAWCATVLACIVCVAVLGKVMLSIFMLSGRDLGSD